MPKQPCPRCGYPGAKPNSRTTLYCRKCGGTVPMQAEPDDTAYYGNDPLQNLIDKERGLHESGRVLPTRNGDLKGGV